MPISMTPSPAQDGALAQFSRVHGPHWRATLKSMWMQGLDANQPNGHLLRQVRNQLGPKWLTTYPPPRIGA